MQDSDRLEIHCASGTLAVLPSRLLLRGPQAWAIPRASVARVSCAEDGEGNYDVTLRLADQRRFLLPGCATADLMRLATVFDDIEGLPPPPEAESSGQDAPPDGAASDDPRFDLPPAEYRPDPPDPAPMMVTRSRRLSGILIVESLPTAPLTVPDSIDSRPAAPPGTPAPGQAPPAARPAPPPRDVPTWAPPPSKVWVPRVTLPPLPTAAFVENFVEPVTPVENFVESVTLVETPDRPPASPADLPSGEREAAPPPATAIPPIPRHPASEQPSTARSPGRRRLRVFWP